MMGTRCDVPTIDISFCFGSSVLNSLLYAVPTCFTSSGYAGPLLSTVIFPEYLTTIALIFLLRSTVPMPPLPACLNLCIRRATSYHEKFKQPIKVCSAPGPAETTEMLRGLSPPYFCAKMSAIKCVSEGNPVASST